MKSFVAVLVGLVATIAVTTLLDILCYTTGIFPADSAAMTSTHWGIATAYRIVVAICGCWLTARLAPSRPLRHALFVGALGMGIALLGAAFTWNAGPKFGPHWYAIGLVVTALPCAWIGGKLHRRAIT